MAIVRAPSNVRTSDDKNSYIKDTGPEEVESPSNNRRKTTSLVNCCAEFGHSRYGHAKSLRYLKGLVQNAKLPYIDCSSGDCELCSKGTFYRKHKASLITSKTTERLQVDTKGELEISSFNAYLYFLTIIDEFSQYTQTYAMKSKSEASELLLNFVKKFEK